MNKNLNKKHSFNPVEEIGGHRKGIGKTNRIDLWWLSTFLTVIGFGLFVLYTIWVAFSGNHYFTDPYLSPFYSPVVFVNPLASGSVPISQALFGVWPDWWPEFFPISPAFFILPFPLVFRLTCYYYRKAYYRSFMLTPIDCGVNPIPQKNYNGETKLFLFQNLHRYTVYFAIIFIFILAYDALLAFIKQGVFGIGVGSLVLTINVLLLASYTFGCHSVRHLFGGRKDSFNTCGGHNCNHTKNKPGITYGFWKYISWLNVSHMKLAWMSLFWVAFTDFYIRMVSMGVFHDFNTWGN